MRTRTEYYSTSTLSGLLRDRSLDERAATAEMIDQYIEKIQEVAEAGLSTIEVSRVIQQSADDFLAEGKRESTESAGIQCGKGCAYCCQQVVAITQSEAMQLITVAKVTGIVIDQDRLKRQAPYREEDWSDQPAEDRACLFLKDNLCQVYENRPLSCRKYFVISPPTYCDNITHPKHPVITWFDFQTELLTTAAFTVQPTGFMPQMLLNVLNPTEDL